MTYKEFIDSVSTTAGVSKADTKRVIESMGVTLKNVLTDAEGEGKVTVAGIGTFKQTFCKEKAYKNPKTKEKGITPAHYRVGFTATSSLRYAVGDVAPMATEIVRPATKAQAGAKSGAGKSKKAKKSKK